MGYGKFREPRETSPLVDFPFPTIPLEMTKKHATLSLVRCLTLELKLNAHHTRIACIDIRQQKVMKISRFGCSEVVDITSKSS